MKHEHDWRDISVGEDGRRLQACSAWRCIDTRIVKP